VQKKILNSKFQTLNRSQ